jgi:hypothetical protein
MNHQEAEKLGYFTKRNEERNGENGQKRGEKHYHMKICPTLSSQYFLTDKSYKNMKRKAESERDT